MSQQEAPYSVLKRSILPPPAVTLDREALVTRPSPFGFVSPALPHQWLSTLTEHSAVWLSALLPADAIAVALQGMRFGDKINWWGLHSERPAPLGYHTGLDFLLYAERNNELQTLAAGTKVSSLCGGRVINIFPDDMQFSIVVKADVGNIDGSALLLLYTHLLPAEGLTIGRDVAAGQQMGELAESRNPKSVVAPHLHLQLTAVRDNALPSFESPEMNFRLIDEIVVRGLAQNFDPLQLFTEDRLAAIESPRTVNAALVVSSESLWIRKLIGSRFPGVQTVHTSTPEDALRILRTGAEFQAIVTDDPSAGRIVSSFLRQRVSDAPAIDLYCYAPPDSELPGYLETLSGEHIGPRR